MREKYLPVGTVVMLEGGTTPMMITGYKVQDGIYNLYDYCGCMYPFGNISDMKGIFNHNQIKEILFLGYENEEFKELNDSLLK